MSVAKSVHNQSSTALAYIHKYRNKAPPPPPPLLHSVSVYFSAVRKIEKKGKTKNIRPAEVCFLMLAFTVHVALIESL